MLSVAQNDAIALEFAKELQQSMHVDIRGGEFAIDEHEITGELFRFLKDG